MAVSGAVVPLCSSVTSGDAEAASGALPPHTLCQNGEDAENKSENISPADAEESPGKITVGYHHQCFTRYPVGNEG